MSVATVTDPIARKEHRCESCERGIEPGEKYHRWEGLTECGWMTFKQCWQCYRLVVALWAIGVRSEGPDGDEVYAWLPDVDWSDLFIRDDGQVWRDRHSQWRTQWPTRWFPEDPESGGSTPQCEGCDRRDSLTLDSAGGWLCPVHLAHEAGDPESGGAA